MLLAGIIVTISFILTSLTLAQVSALERQAVNERTISLAEEWRFLHDRIGGNLEIAVSPETTNATFNDTIFPTLIATFRGIEMEKGFDTVIRLAGDKSMANRTETEILNAGNTNYDALAVDDSLTFSWPYDGVNDGIIWKQPCENAAAPAAGCIQGVLVFVHVTDGINTMEEVILYAVNRADG